MNSWIRNPPLGPRQNEMGKVKTRGNLAAAAPFTGSLHWVIRNQPTERQACYCLLCHVLGSRGKEPRRDRILESSPCCLPARAARGGKRGKSCTASPPPPPAQGGPGGACGLLPCRGAVCTGSTWASACPAPPFQHPVLIWVLFLHRAKGVWGLHHPLNLWCSGLVHHVPLLTASLSSLPHRHVLPASLGALSHCSTAQRPRCAWQGLSLALGQLCIFSSGFWWDPVCSSCSIVIYEAVLTNTSQVPGLGPPLPLIFML